MEMIRDEGLYREHGPISDSDKNSLFYFAGEYTENKRKLIIHYHNKTDEICKDSSFWNSYHLEDPEEYVNELEKKASSLLNLSKTVKKLLREHRHSQTSPKCTDESKRKYSDIKMKLEHQEPQGQL